MELVCDIDFGTRSGHRYPPGGGEWGFRRPPPFLRQHRPLWSAFGLGDRRPLGLEDDEDWTAGGRAVGTGGPEPDVAPRGDYLAGP